MVNLWVLLAIFMNFFYLSVLRSQLIKPRLEKPIDTLEQTSYLELPTIVPMVTG